MAETIVMIHGMWGTGSHWENFKGFFEGRGYRCVIPTLRFHDMDPKGIPDPSLGTTSLLDYAEDLEKLIRELHVMPILMGFSLGGLLVQILGSRGLAKALVLLSPAPPYGINALTPSVALNFRSALMRWGFWRKPFRLPFAETSYSMLNLMPSETRRSIYDKLVYESGRAACEIGFWFFDRKGAARVDESKVTCPALIVTGEEDREHPVSVIRKIARRYKEVVTYKELLGHGHWLIGEPGWQEIAESIEQWLGHSAKSGKRDNPESHI